MEVLTRNIKKCGMFFYLTNPEDSSFETVEEVPDYVKEITPLFIGAMLLEQIIRYQRGKFNLRINDTIANASQGILMELFRIPARGLEVVVYSYLYNNYRLATLPWDCVWTWLLCMFCTDFCFYWMHRLTHQVSFLWAIHEVHHSSEDMNLTIPLRNNFLLISAHWLTYLPMALAIPPSVFLVHYQFNLIFQYWIHTELIGKLGYVELLFVTPSHHRIHHGRNRKCIDKNFGGLLIIWDRIFGTYEEEVEEEEISYGITHPLTTFNPLVIQTNHFKNMLKLFWNVSGFNNKLSAIFKGPGWSPGKPRLGYLHEIPEPEPGMQKYDPVIPKWHKVYIVVHFLLIVSGYVQIGLNHQILSTFLLIATSAFIVLSLVSIGVIMDNSPNARLMELVRCPLFFILREAIYSEVAEMGAFPLAVLQLCQAVHFASFVICLGSYVFSMNFKLYLK